MNALNKLYEAMLKSWGCSFTADAAVMLNFGGTEVPVKVDDKQVFLATSENLNGVTIGKVFFHPACESIMSKETEIFKVIRKLTAAKIYAVFQPICEVLFTVASKKSGKTLSGKMLETLEPFKGVSKAVRQEVIDIIKTISITIEDQGTDTRLINFSLMKGGKTDNDEAIYYTATPSFPFYTELYRAVAQNDHLKPADRLTFNNLNVSMQAMRVVIALFETALPACIDPSRKKYSATNSDAARLVAYLHSYSLVASDMNSLIGKFRKEFDSIGIYGIDLDYISELDGIGEIKKLIPALDYNNYNITSSADEPAANNGARISSFNPLAGVTNTISSSSGQQINQGSSNVPASAPKIPDAQPGETYIGCDYSPNNGIYEYKFQQSNGMIRARCLAEDGRFISEQFHNPMQAQMGMMPGMQMPGMNPMMQMPGMQVPMNGMMPGMNPMMMPGMSGMQMPIPGMNATIGASGIPMYGMQAPPGYGIDPYTNQMVAVPQQAPQQAPMPNSFGNSSPFAGYGTAGINNI